MKKPRITAPVTYPEPEPEPQQVRIPTYNFMRLIIVGYFKSLLDDAMSAILSSMRYAPWALGLALFLGQDFITILVLMVTVHLVLTK